MPQADVQPSEVWSAHLLRWRVDSQHFVVSTQAVSAGGRGLPSDHLMNFQIGLGPQHLDSDGNSGLCTKRCAGISIANSVTCAHSECEALEPSESVLNEVNPGLYNSLSLQCHANTNPRSSCDPPSSAELCRSSGFPVASALEACSSLRTSPIPLAYESCIFDCCAIKDSRFCRSLAESTVAQTREFEQELITDGRFINVQASRPFFELNATLPAPTRDRLVCTITFGNQNEQLEGVELPNGLGTPSSLEEVRSNVNHVLLMLDSRGNRTEELEAVLELAHIFEGALYPCTELHVAAADIREPGAVVLAASLQRGAMPRLEQLVLSPNKIGSGGAMALAAAMRSRGPRGLTLRNLKVLSLRSNEIGDDAVIEITNALREGALQSLQYVDLTDNPLNSTLKTRMGLVRSGLVVR